MNLDEAFERLLDDRHEGGYVSAEQARRNNDPGGETNLGISSARYPREDIAGMTRERAKFLYRRDYWGPACCDAVPDAIKYPLFDFAVNSGPTRAIKSLQSVVGATPDGVLGPLTLQALANVDPRTLAAHYLGDRLEFMTSLSNWHENSRGWARRIAAELKAVG